MKKQQIPFFITKRHFTGAYGKQVEQWWAYVWKEGSYLPFLGSADPCPIKSFEIMISEINFEIISFHPPVKEFSPKYILF